MKDQVYIIGSGAIGKVLAVAFKSEQRNVTLLRGSVDDEPSHTQKISVVLNDQSEIEAEIEISTLSNFAHLNGIVVLTNKSYGNENLSRRLKDKIGDSPVVILQNGLGIERPFLENNFPEIYRCVLFVTSQNLAAEKVSFKPVAVSPIGIIKGNTDNLERIVENLNTTLFSFKAEKDIQTVIWKKAIINSVFNSVCPLLEVDNGIFHRDKKVLALAQRVIRECVTISNQSGVQLNANEVAERLLLISKSSDGQLISTLQDINHKRPTEIDTLNFEIVRLAESLNLGNAVIETKLLGELTKLKSIIKSQ